jgi:opacity protein-like surface antigen
MSRPSFLIVFAAASVTLGLAAAPVAAQLVEVSDQKRFEITPYAGYQWGGSFETQGGGSFPAGSLHLQPSFAWGAILSFLAYGNSAVELTYLRQDTDIEFDPAGSGGTTNLGGFAMNYIQIGGRQQFGRHDAPLKPFASASLGINILDPAAEGIESATRFSWSFGGGAQYMFASGRAGLRTDLKFWATPVPSGTYGTWCDFYGCFVTEGTAWVTQGQVSGGLVLAF